MTVKELKKRLENVPDNLEVMFVPDDPNVPECEAQDVIIYDDRIILVEFVAGQ